MATQLLLADDSPTIAKILQMALSSEPYQIRAVLTAEEALRALKDQPPHLFLVDLSLPGKSGYEFARLIRQDNKLRDVRVVLLASAFEPVDDGEFAQCGADGLVKKPFDPAELRAKLREVLEAPPRHQAGAPSHAVGSLSGFMVADPSDSTKTGLTVGGITAVGLSDTNPGLVAPQPLMGGGPPSAPPAFAPPAARPPASPPGASAPASTAEDPLAGLLTGNAAPDAPTGSNTNADAILAGLLSGNEAPDSPPPFPGGAGEPEPATLPDLGSSEDYRPEKTIAIDMSGESMGGSLPDEPVLDLSAAFGSTPPGGTQQIDVLTQTISAPAPAPAEAPASAAASAPASASASAPAPASAAGSGRKLPEQPPPPPAAAMSKPAAKPSPAEEPLSANAQALAAFFEAEIHSNAPAAPAAPEAPPAPPAEEPAQDDAFDASLDSIDWTSGPAEASLAQWSSSKVPAPEKAAASPSSDLPPKAPPAGRQVPNAMPAPFGPPKGRPAAPGFADASSGELAAVPGAKPERAPVDPMFDTGESTFRFSQDYVRRITKSFTGADNESVPEKHAMFPQQSDDRTPPPASHPGFGEEAAAPAPAQGAGGPGRGTEPLTAGPGGGAWSEKDVAMIEKIVREEVQMVVREVAEKIAWEVIPELAENLIKKELERVLKEMGQ